MGVAEYFFHQGTNSRAYEYMGAHRNENGSVTFRVWAPHAVSVSVVGDFNDWKEEARCRSHAPDHRRRHL